MTDLPEHFREVVHVGRAQRLCLESLGLKQVLRDVRRVDQHPVQWPLFVSVGVKHDLKRRVESVSPPPTDCSLIS